MSAQIRSREDKNRTSATQPHSGPPNVSQVRSLISPASDRPGCALSGLAAYRVSLALGRRVTCTRHRSGPSCR